MAATSNVIDEEKMGIILQEVSGSRYGDRFYPTFSGVARSINFYPIKPEKPEDGIANIAFGLGKYIVDGGVSLRFSPKYAKKVLQLSSPEIILRDTQKTFFALDMNPESFITSTDDAVNLLRLKIKDAEIDNSLRSVASVYDLQNHIIRDGYNIDGKKVITFSNILNHGTFPLADILQTLLAIGQKEMNLPIEIEFAVNLNVPEGAPKVFHFLQIRPIVDNDQSSSIAIDEVRKEETIILSNSALGNGVFDWMNDLVYIKPDSFDPSQSEKMAQSVERINSSLREENKNYVLIGPGRWGSSDPWLGIPIKWPQISEARIIVESGLEKYRIDPSQGTHFFQNLTSFGVGYLTINPYINDGFYDIEYLMKQDAFFEDQYVRHIRFKNPLLIMIDGKTNRGVIYKEQKRP